MRRISLSRVWLCVAFTASGALMLGGCGGADGPETVPVSGTIMLDGQPLAGAEVNFVTENFAAVAQTGPDGTYTLVQGAVPGENKVYITKWVGDKSKAMSPEEAMEEGMDAGQMQAMIEAAGPSGAALPDDMPRQIIPPQYSDPEQTILKFIVPDGGTEAADLRIKSQ